jgi:hypothetical protein
MSDANHVALGSPELAETPDIARASAPSDHHIAILEVGVPPARLPQQRGAGSGSLAHHESS